MYVACAVFIANDKVLLMRRAEGHSMAGGWEYPGGKIETGETGAACVKRELKEELLIDAEIGELIGSAKLELKDKTLKLDAYRVISYRGNITLTDHDKMEWVSIDELIEHEQLPADLEISRKLHEYINRQRTKEIE